MQILKEEKWVISSNNCLFEVLQQTSYGWIYWKFVIYITKECWNDEIVFIASLWINVASLWANELFISLFFCKNIPSEQISSFLPFINEQFTWSVLYTILPKHIGQTLIDYFSKHFKMFRLINQLCRKYCETFSPFSQKQIFCS